MEITDEIGIAQRLTYDSDGQLGSILMEIRLKPFSQIEHLKRQNMM